MLADGKIYVGTDGGKFFIIRPGADRAQILSEVELPNSVTSCCGSEGTPEQVLGGAAVSRGRVFFVSSDAIYAIGPRQARAATGFAVNTPAETGAGMPAHVQVAPTELVLEPGETVRLRARLFDDKGRFLREEKATWSLEGLKGTVTDGAFTVAADPSEQAGLIKATVGGLTGQARARVVRPLPWNETFEAYADGAVPAGWVNAVAGQDLPWPRSTGRRCCRRRRTKPSSSASAPSSGRPTGPTTASKPTCAPPRGGARWATSGITAQRYSLVLYGISQRLKIEAWEPETTRTATVPFAWKPDTWYRLKLRVENLPNGAVRAQGKAWPVGEAEPAAWTIEKVDPIGNREGAPGPLHRRAVRRVSRQLQDDGQSAGGRAAAVGRQQAVAT